MDRRRLPIGIQTFRKIREDDAYYVDKTPYIERLLKGGTHHFLSRPRRFGKSLFLDTLKELFEGNAELFEGLAICDKWDWSVRYPVVRVSFGSGHFASEGDLRAETGDRLREMEDAAGISDPPAASDAGRLRHLIRTLHGSTGQRVVVLIDEYDKPILDALHAPDVARANRDYLRGLYAVVKDCDAHIRFSFITGVSKFSKVSLFSGLNNLTDITLDPEFSGICGYTESDLETVFAPELPGLDRDEIREWYNGYSWLGEEKVYNPFDILLLFRSREFKAHWMETGSPTFLVETLSRRQVRSVDLDAMRGTEELLTSFDVDEITPEALLFQTGYLTIQGKETRGARTSYRLGYPNREVQLGLNESLLRHWVRNDTARTRNTDRLYDLLEASDLPGLEAVFRSFFASIPYEWYTNNDIANFEGYYASVFYSYFAALGLDVAAEESTNRGRLDMAVRFEDRVYIFEFKVVEQAGEGSAMAQLQDRGYADKYRAPGVTVHLVGVEFSSESRNVVAFEHAAA